MGGTRRTRRLLAPTVVFALLASISLAILPATRADAATETYYLKGTGAPKADLSTAAPVSGSLPNYDPGEDSEPGRTLDKTDGGWNESDSGKYQLWVARNGEMAINGQVTLTFWSAMKDFEDEKGGRVEAFLLDCNQGGNNCVLIDQGSRESTPWSPSGSWVSNTIDFGSVTYSIASNRALAVKVVVGDDSDDDMWFAYDTTSYPSRLSMQTVATTTTTTTAAATTTTTVPATAPPPPSPTTTVAPIVGSTSTTTPTADGSSTTLAVTFPPGQGPGPTDESGPAEPTEEGGGIPVAGSLFDLSVGIVGDPVLATMGLDASVILTRGDSWTGSIIKGLELVIPPWAATMVASPFMIFGFVLEAMTDSGQAIMLPVALLLAGMLWVFVESRGFTFAFLGRPKDNEGDS